MAVSASRIWAVGTHSAGKPANNENYYIYLTFFSVFSDCPPKWQGSAAKRPKTLIRGLRKPGCSVTRKVCKIIVFRKNLALRGAELALSAAQPPEGRVASQKARTHVRDCGDASRSTGDAQPRDYG